MKVGDQVVYQGKQAAIAKIRGAGVDLVVLEGDVLTPVENVVFDALSAKDPNGNLPSAEAPALDKPTEVQPTAEKAKEQKSGWFGFGKKDDDNSPEE